MMYSQYDDVIRQIQMNSPQESDIRLFVQIFVILVLSPELFFYNFICRSMKPIQWGPKQYIIWKKSQYLGQWQQRLLSMSDPTIIKTAKEQSVNSQLNANFTIPVAQIKKISLYPKKYIADGEKVSLKIEYSRTTLMADTENLMIDLFGTIVVGKFMFETEEILEKKGIKGHEMKTKQRIESTFIVYRKDGIFNKQFKRQQMFVTSVRLMCYDKIGFGKDMGTPNWQMDRKNLRKISTTFEIFKNNLVVRLYSGLTSYQQFAVPAQGTQLLELLHVLCRGNTQYIQDD